MSFVCRQTDMLCKDTHLDTEELSLLSRSSSEYPNRTICISKKRIWCYLPLHSFSRAEWMWI